jgi:hypothetical protein
MGEEIINYDICWIAKAHQDFNPYQQNSVFRLQQDKGGEIPVNVLNLTTASRVLWAFPLPNSNKMGHNI